MTFEECVIEVLRFEAGWVNNPADPGGETNFGISKSSYPQLDIKNLTREAAIAIYKRDYWERISADRLPNQIRLLAFDTAVLHGVKFSIATIQAIMGMPATGEWTEANFFALDTIDPKKIIERIAVRRMLVYKGSKNWVRFGAGWSTRLLEVTCRSYQGGGSSMV